MRNTSLILIPADDEQPMRIHAFIDGKDREPSWKELNAAIGCETGAVVPAIQVGDQGNLYLWVDDEGAWVPDAQVNTRASLLTKYDHHLVGDCLLFLQGANGEMQTVPDGVCKILMPPRKKTLEAGFDNSEYLAGPEPSPYSGTYSEM